MTTKKGFTLIELLVVIAIIGILSTLAVVALNNARTKARDAKRVSDIKQVQTALELYFGDNTSYPSGSAAAIGTGNFVQLCSAGFDNGSSACATTTYMGSVPKDPLNTGGNVYTYTQTGSGTGYTLTFSLEGTTGGLSSGAHTADANGIK